MTQRTDMDTDAEVAANIDRAEGRLTALIEVLRANREVKP